MRNAYPEFLGKLYGIESAVVIAFRTFRSKKGELDDGGLCRGQDRHLFGIAYIVYFSVLFDVGNDNFLQGNGLVFEEDFNVFRSVCRFTKF